MKNKILKAGELAVELMKDPEAEVVCGAWNGYVDTYAGVDHIFKSSYDEISNDFYGTPGRIDKRVLEGKGSIFLIGSLFGKVPNAEIDFGNDNIDYEISKINGEEGDSCLIWKLSGFTSPDLVTWKKEGDGWGIEYRMDTQTLDANNFRAGLRFVGKVIGIETLRNVISVCKIDCTIWS